MAMFPCSACGQRYPGRQQTAYLHLVQGATEIGGRQRLCPTDFMRMYDLLDTTCDLTVLGDQMQELESDRGSRCCSCESKGVVTMVFAHLYPAKAERRSYMGSLCQDCTLSMQDTLKIAS